MAYSAKRRFQRSAQTDGVKIRTPHGVEYAIFDDLSAGGMRLWTDHSMELGTLMQIEFSLKNKEGALVNLKNSAIVARCVKAKVGGSDGYYIGIQFRESLSPEWFVDASNSEDIDVSSGPF